jgi:hypothetical protein
MIDRPYHSEENKEMLLKRRKRVYVILASRPTPAMIAYARIKTG